MLVLSRGAGDHTIMGSTLDDSIGEAFDKTARLLGITAIPGGPPLEALARGGDPRRHALPKPLTKTKDPVLRSNCDFSYAGLKTSVRQLLDQQLPASKRAAMSVEQLQLEFAHVAASFQRVAVEHLAERTARAICWAREVEPTLSSLVAAGGVAANGEVRRRLAQVRTVACLLAGVTAVQTNLMAARLFARQLYSCSCRTFTHAAALMLLYPCSFCS